jgi:hypothetical protein
VTDGFLTSVAFSIYTMNTRTSLITVTSLTATFVALCAAVFSVSGIAKLFAGAALSAAVMASALELGKIVSISFLYQYWKEIPRTLKAYLAIAAVVLMVITSAGIYGYLSSAYAKVAATPIQLSADIRTAENRVKTLEDEINRKNQRLDQLITLRAQQENRLDSLIIRSTTGNSSAVRNAQNGLTAADQNVTSLQQEVSQLSAQRDSLRGLAIAKQVEIETNGDIGTFVYIAKILGTDLDTVVKWFTLIIVLVFDPLAVALVIAVNFLLKNKPAEDNKIVKEIKHDLPTVEEPYRVYVPEPTSEPVHDTAETPAESTPIPTEAHYMGNDPQFYARGDFDWKNRKAWEWYAPAVQYYEERIKPHLKTT